MAAVGRTIINIHIVQPDCNNTPQKQVTLLHVVRLASFAQDLSHNASILVRCVTTKLALCVYKLESKISEN